jgi:hypothetical protein
MCSLKNQQDMRCGMMSPVAFDTAGTGKKAKSAMRAAMPAFFMHAAGRL